MTAHDTQETPMTLEQLLAQHTYKGYGSSPGIAILCSCGETSYHCGMDYPHTSDQWRAHVASEVRAWLVGLLDTPQLHEQVAEMLRESIIRPDCEICNDERGVILACCDCDADAALNVVRDAIGGGQ